VFLINVPVGLVGLALSVRFVPRDLARARSSAPFDVPGAVLFTVGLVAFMWGLNQASDWGWTSPLLVACMGFSVVVLAAFVWLELHVSSPMLDLKLFRIRLFSAAVATATLSYVATFAMTFLLPFYLIEARGLSPAQAGLVLTAMPLFMPILAAISGAWSDRVGSRLPATLGMLLTTCGLFALSTIGLETPLAFVTAALALIGIGSGLFTSPNTSAALGAAPRQQRGLASGVVATARNVGMVVGLGLGGAILSTVVGTNAGAPTPATIAQAVDTGLRVAGVIAALGALLSATRDSNVAVTALAAAPSEAHSGR
jgi:MFS family permease